VLRSVTRQGLIASRAQFEPLARVLATVLAQVSSPRLIVCCNQISGPPGFPRVQRKSPGQPGLKSMSRLLQTTTAPALLRASRNLVSSRPK
jgi:hypothetical protein